MSQIAERLRIYATTASYGSDLREAAEEIERLEAEAWQPIATLPEPDTDIVLWNPCDGAHIIYLWTTERKLNEIRQGAVYSHWRRLRGPGREGR